MAGIKDMNLDMRPEFQRILAAIKNKDGATVIDVNLPERDFIYLQYFLTSQFYYAAVIDDYPLQIADKDSLLDALYFQLKLVLFHRTNNWDAFKEIFEYGIIDDFSSFKGFCLLFKRGRVLRQKLAKDFNILAEVLGYFENAGQHEFKIIIA